jgi:cytochrome P450
VDVSSPKPFPTREGPALDPDPLIPETVAGAGVQRIQPAYGRPCWVVARYDDVRVVLGDTRFVRHGTWAEDASRTTEINLLQPGTLNAMDGPEHARLRRFVSRTFTARRVDALRPRAAAVTQDLLDAVEHHGPPVDLVEALALPLPIRMICELLGVPAEDHAGFRAWTAGLMVEAAHDTAVLERALASWQNLQGYLLELVEARRSAPADDLLSAVTLENDAGDALTDDEIATVSVGLLVGGFETTAHMIGKSLLWLFQHPDHLAALRADLGLVPTAVEELLRHIPLAGGVSLPFIASEDVELPGAGARIEAGEYVMPALAGANLDDAAFPCAAEVRLDRSPNPHVSFGYGAHYCLGAHLARMEMQVAFDALLRRFPRLELAVPAGDVPWKQGSAVWGLAALPVTF